MLLNKENKGYQRTSEQMLVQHVLKTAPECNNLLVFPLRNGRSSLELKEFADWAASFLPPYQNIGRSRLPV